MDLEEKKEDPNPRKVQVKFLLHFDFRLIFTRKTKNVVSSATRRLVIWGLSVNASISTVTYIEWQNLTSVITTIKRRERNW